jgi:hypothetical protein
MDANKLYVPTSKESTYQITIEGILKDSWSDWFGGIEISCSSSAGGLNVTVLNGSFPDQAALRGVLMKLWDLNATLLEVKRVDPR